jgi:hypothetical protein
MEKVGWLHIDDDGSVTLPHFDTHNGETAKQRGLTAKRVAKSKAKSNAEANGKVTYYALPREEKRREENIDTLVVSVADNCPHEQIIALYHEHLPMLPTVKVWNAKRRELLRARWREDGKRQTLEFWTKYFRYVAASDFLTGRSGKFTANLEWLVNASNFVKVIEGNYENRGAV